MSNPKANPCKVVTGVVRSSFMRLIKLEEDDNGNKKCGSMFIIPKKDKTTVSKIEKAVDAASQKKFGKKANKKSRSFSYPLRDGDNVDDLPDSVDAKTVKGCYFVNTNAYKVPGLVDSDNEAIEDIEDRETMLMSGYYYKVSITFKGFDNESKGIRAEINNVMFIKEGERLDGGVAADSEDWGDDVSPEDDDNDGYSPDKIKELCAELEEETDKDTLKEVLSDFDCKTARNAAKLDDDERTELGEALEEAIEDA